MGKEERTGRGKKGRGQEENERGVGHRRTKGGRVEKCFPKFYPVQLLLTQGSSDLQATQFMG